MSAARPAGRPGRVRLVDRPGRRVRDGERVAVGLGLTGFRLLRGERFGSAVGSVLGVAAAAGIVAWTGSAKDFFVIGIWAALAGFAVQQWLYLADSTGGLGVARIVTGVPLTVLAALVVVRALRCSTTRLVTRV
jgi:Protein of unknown function (DUF3159)